MDFLISIPVLLFLVAGSVYGQYEDLEQRVTYLESCSRCRTELELTGNRTSRKMLLAVGGMTQEMDAVELYDPLKNEWTRVEHLPRPMQGMPQMPMGAAVGAITDPGKSSRVIFCSGMPTDANCYRYDPDLDTWYADVAAAKKPRHFAGIASPRDGFLYKVGGQGMDHHSPATDSPSLPIERYDPVKNYWKFLRTLPNAIDSSGKSKSQYGTVTTGLKGIVYIAGYGHDEKDHSEVATLFMVYNPATNEIGILAEKPVGLRGGQFGHPLVGVRFWSLGSLVWKYYVYALDSCGTRLDRYDVVANRWRTVMLRSPLAASSKRGELCGVTGGLVGLNDDGKSFDLFIAGGQYQEKDRAEQSKATYRLILTEDFDSQPTRWTQMADLNSARSDFSLITIDKILDY